MGTPSPQSKGPPLGRTCVFASANIVGEGEWEPWISSAEDTDAMGSDDDYGASPTPEPDVVLGGESTSSGEEKYTIYDSGDVDATALGAYMRRK
jgi:hypothetical protein